MHKPGTEPAQTTFYSVQDLRGIAAVAVVYFHTKIYLSDFAWSVDRQFGYGGVDLFFAISGFIMMVTTFRGNETPLSFYAKRIVRVVPLYWGATLASLALFVAVPAAFIKETATFNHVLLSMLFIPHPAPSGTGAAPFFTIGWTLNFEMFFYLVFGLTLLLAQAWQRLLAIAIFFFSMVSIGAVFEPKNAALGYYTNPFVLEFLMGTFVGYLACKGWLVRIPRAGVWAGTIAALACVFFLGGYQRGDSFERTLIFGIPAAALVAFAVATEMRGRVPKIALLRHLGDASYSIYLAHPFVLTGFKVVARTFHLPVADRLVGGVGIVLAVITTACFGYLIFIAVERPLLRIMRRALVTSEKKPKPEPAPTLTLGGNLATAKLLREPSPRIADIERQRQ
jgi:exopolysaccharide production protein ExoZ